MNVKTIAFVAEETGITKEVLRKWETRYGFPSPERDTLGNRVYRGTDIERIKLIKRLLDQGMRAGQVVPLGDIGLKSLIGETESSRASVALGGGEQVMAWLSSHNPRLLEEKLKAEIAKHGPRYFVLNIMPAMNALVGTAWAQGQLSIREEHLYTEMVQKLLRKEIVAVQITNLHPRILLATPPGELHTLGLLMLEAVLTMEGACCISLGAQLPVDEIVLAAKEYEVEVVGLSFSETFPLRKIAPFLKEVRSRLPENIRLWAGGQGVVGLKRKPHGIYLFTTIAAAIAALN